MFYMKSIRQGLGRLAILIMAASLISCGSSGGDSSTGSTGTTGGSGYGSVSLTGTGSLPSTYTPDLGLLTNAGGLDIITFTQAVTATRMVIISVTLDPAGVVTVLSDSDSATGGTSSWIVKNLGDAPTTNQATRTVKFSDLQMVNVSTGDPVTVSGTLNYDTGPSLVP
jgi:hypothetical protein